MQHTSSLTVPQCPTAIRRLEEDPQRTLLVLPDAALPASRLLHTVRHYAERYGLAMEVLTETDVTPMLCDHPGVLSGRLIRLPASHFTTGAPAQAFVDREGLIQALHTAGAWVHILTRLERWGVLTDPLQWLAVLERGVIVPPKGYETFAPAAKARAPHPHRPEDDPNFVDSWLGKRYEWCGVPTAIRRD